MWPHAQGLHHIAGKMQSTGTASAPLLAQPLDERRHQLSLSCVSSVHGRVHSTLQPTPAPGMGIVASSTLPARERWEAVQRAAHSRSRGSGTTSARRLRPGLWALGCTSSRASRSRLAWKLPSTSSCCARCASYLQGVSK